MALSNMMKHFLEIKEKYNDCIVFYRLGDFYELFFEDAEIVSKVLELTLTGKNCGLESRAPMCGFPHDAVDVYSAKLVGMGYKVAICEQLTDAALGPVERDVVRVITPGTITDGELLDSNKNNYISTVSFLDNQCAIAWADITTGEFNVKEFTGENRLTKLNELIGTIIPSEVVVNEMEINNLKELPIIKLGQITNIFKYYNWVFNVDIAKKNITEKFGLSKFSELEKNNNISALIAVGSLLAYLLDTQKRDLKNITSFKFETKTNYLALDYNSRRNLELVESFNQKKRRGSLLWVLDETKTSMGARLLRQYVQNPLCNHSEINARLEAVNELFTNNIIRDGLVKNLQYINDIERLCGKISYGNITPKDCVSIKNTLNNIPTIFELIRPLQSKLFKDIINSSYNFSFLADFLDKAINSDAPSVLKEGTIIKSGFNNNLDEFRAVKKDGKHWISMLEAEEKKQTGIKNLRISYNNVFGYFIEVTKSQLNLVPYRYERRQTLANCERYITPELKTMEVKILDAEEKSYQLEIELFNQVKNELINNLHELQVLAGQISVIDVINSFATVAVKNNYCKPTINNKDYIDIKGGRHPVVELINRDEPFIANDCYLNNADDRTMIITGPNMAGKSTFMRQVALIVIMAHMGSFVPANSANICLTDKVFTRIGASDDLAFGQSTFMVEMMEVSNILNNATSKSLIILDEVGRGTATFDGLSIAWAVMEYLSKQIKAKTLFSTHYHELSELEGVLEGVKNYRITVKEFNGTIIFLRKITRGSALKSFGIEVAKLAGLPEELINKSKEILKALEQKDISLNLTPNDFEGVNTNKKANEVCNIIKLCDINKISPFEAQQLLFDLKEKLK